MYSRVGRSAGGSGRLPVLSLPFTGFDLEAVLRDAEARRRGERRQAVGFDSLEIVGDHSLEGFAGAGLGLSGSREQRCDGHERECLEPQVVPFVAGIALGESSRRS